MLILISGPSGQRQVDDVAERHRTHRHPLRGSGNVRVAVSDQEWTQLAAPPPSKAYPHRCISGR